MTAAAMTRTLSSVAGHVSGRLIGDDRAFDSVGTDTRTLTPGALFVAIRGERFDGNDYVADAAARGAAGALVSRPAALSLPQIEVADTRIAFGHMARSWRRNFAIPVIAVTGSSGKTTVKGLIGSILSVRRKTCVTEGSLNNDIGVPLTLMRLAATHQVLVAEIAANHPGEIDYLASLVEPAVGVLTNAGPAHLEGFGSLDGVAAAKGELLDHLPKAGTVVLNADDRYYDAWQARARCDHRISFGFGPLADCTVIGDVQAGPIASDFRLCLPDGVQVEVHLPLPGRHNVANALAAAAAAHAVGATSDDIAQGLARAGAARGRLNVLRGRRGARVIDDSYNANPASARAAIDLLAGLEGRRILVLGDMAELGPGAAALHRDVGEYARGRCDRLIAIGSLAAAAAEGFGTDAVTADEPDEAIPLLESLLAPDVTVLVKASRVMGLERIVARIAGDRQEGE